MLNLYSAKLALQIKTTQGDAVYWKSAGSAGQR